MKKIDTRHALQQRHKLQILLSPLSVAKEEMNTCQLQQADKVQCGIINAKDELVLGI